MKRDRRNVPYRPPLQYIGWQGGSWPAVVRFLWGYLRPHRRGILIGILLLSLNGSAGYLLAWYSRIVVDRILVVTPGEAVADTPAPAVTLRARERRAPRPPRPHGDLHEHTRAVLASPRPPDAARRLTGMFLVFTGTLITLNLIARKAIAIRIGISRDVTRSLRDDLHAKVLALSKSYHQRHPPGRLLARILSDVDALRKELTQTVFQASQQLYMVVLGLGLLTVVDWRMPLAFILVIVPFCGLVRYFQIRMIPLHREARHTNSCMYGYSAQKLDAIRAVFAYGREAGERRVFRQLSHCLFRDTMDRERLGAQLNVCAALISAGATLGLFLVGSAMVLERQLSLGEMLFAYTVTATLFAPVISLTQISVAVSSLLVLGQRLMQILEEPLEVAEPPGGVAFPTPLRKHIAIRNVRFTYSPESEPALQGVSLQIPVGQWFCLMGPSGSGKSSLLYLLSRLHDPQAGRITVDGIPLPTIRFESLRQHMALVPQEAQIFTGTVRDNIAYGDPDATPARIMAAAKAAECHDFIMQMPIQYESLVGERGTTLSGGQRQRISIARALLHEPEVLLLDDVTSALDADTERRIQATLARLMQNKTAVVVSQRVSMAMRCHRICILEHGLITEEGSHAELMEKHGYYARLVRQQIR